MPTNPTLLQFPQVDADASLRDQGDVPDGTPGVTVIPGARGMRPSGAFEDLAYYRSEYPFVGILPVPSRVINAVLVQNVVTNIDIPSGVALIMFRMKTSAMNCWFSFMGNAQIPVAGTNIYDEIMSQSVYNIVDQMFYVKTVKQISLISPDATGTCIVSMMCWNFINPTGGIFNEDLRNLGNLK